MDDVPSVSGGPVEDAPAMQIPAAWKDGRAVNAEDWFAAQRDKCVRSYHDGNMQSAADAQACQAAEEADVAKRSLLDQHREELQFARLQLVSTKTQMLHAVEDSPFAKVLSFPHFVSPRPIVVLSHVSSTSFIERLLCRGLVSSLLANAADREVEAAGGTDGRLLDVVWWDALQGHLAAPHKALARMEALECCRCVVLLLSRQYCAALGYDSERALLLNRMLQPQAYRCGPLQAVVAVRLIESESDRLLNFPVPPAPDGAHQPLPVVYIDVEVSTRPPQQPHPAALLARALEQLRDPLSSAGIDLLPEAEVSWHPSQTAALSCSAASAAAAATTLSSTAPMAQSLFPATLSGGQEQAWAAAHRMPHPHQHKPVDAWSWGDVQMWMQTLGHSTSLHAPGLLRLSVDGWLLSAATTADLAAYCGVTSATACKYMVEQLALLRRTEGTNGCVDGFGAAAVGSTPGSLAEIMSLSEVELSQMFADVLLFYDVDASGDLNPTETASLLDATGLLLSPATPVATDLAAEILAAYDADGDGALNRVETHRLLNDVVCLLVARSDASGAWATMTHATSSSRNDDIAEAGSMTGMTGTAGPNTRQLQPEMEHAITSSDLQHRGLLDLPALRQALGHGTLSRSLSPLHMWLLVRRDQLRATDIKQLSRTAGGSLAVRGQYIADSVAVVADSCQQLQSVVYDPHSGTAAVLAALYRQTAAATGRDSDRGAVSVDVATEVLSAYLGTLGGRRNPLIQHAILQEAVATAFALDVQDPVVIWSQVVAHMMYVLQQL